MAKAPEIQLEFDGGCPDCGSRLARALLPLPEIGDDFDWALRDMAGFRRFMLEELAALHPERRRWTPADMEVVLIDLFAVVLDQLSDMADRVAAEAWLETARRPESVRALLALIGYDAAQEAFAEGRIENADAGELERYWRREPAAMEVARRAGPQAVRRQHRMVTVEDYASRLEEHPLVLRAHARSVWGGSWPVLHVTALLWDHPALKLPLRMDDALPRPEDQTADTAEARGLRRSLEQLRQEITTFHRELDLEEPDWPGDVFPRDLLAPYVREMRMAGQHTELRDADRVGIRLAITVQAGANFYQSEIRRAALEALGRGPTGFFRAGRLRFGEDLHAGDLYESLMSLDGVDHVCLNRFKRVGRAHADATAAGLIELRAAEIAVCYGDSMRPELGYITLKVRGGLRG